MSSAYTMHPKKASHKPAARATVSFIYERANVNIKTQPCKDSTLSDTTNKFRDM